MATSSVTVAVIGAFCAAVLHGCMVPDKHQRAVAVPGTFAAPGSVPAPHRGNASDVPASLLDLSRWKLTLPLDTERPGNPDEIRQPELTSFADRECFFVDPERKAVIFRARCGGSTTKGSGYPRSELREMDDSGKAGAAWSTDGDTMHVMSMKAAITATPAVKQHVVAAQIHDADADVLMIRLEGTKLLIEREGQPDVVLTRKYVLGTPFTLSIAAGGGRIVVVWEGQRVLDWPVSRKGCYFKAGCYTQSNPSKGDAADSFGEVAIHELCTESTRSGRQP